MEKKVIGVTGGLATGKTTVAQMFAAKGAEIVDADEIAHDLLEKDEDIKFKVVGMFGSDILIDGKIDRRKLGKKVFRDRTKLNALCGIMHPVIIFRIRELVKRSPSDVVVVDAPLLIESGLDEFVDKVVVVTADERTQVKRATDRGMSEEEAKRIMDCQMALSEKTRFADYIIDNSTKIKDIKEGVERIWQET
ncbi:MAG: dephospho-CoA kinase [Candidatus Omnitrophica bacterium]|nr:dephospho-CoA kinase [Candidatus Omnitrophota bacterium]